MSGPIFIHGRNTRVLFSNGHTKLGYDLSQFFNDASVSNEAEAAETTTFQTGSSKSYIVGLRSGMVTLSGFYDSTDTTGIDYIMAEAVGTAPYSITDPYSDHQENTIMVYANGGSTQNERCYMALGINTKYDLKSPVSGVVSLDAEVTADGGIRTGKGSIFSAAGEATGLVHYHTTANAAGGPTTNGGDLIVSVISLTGTSPSLSLTFQHSADNSTWVDTGAIAVTSVGSTVVSSGGLPSTIYKYTRLDWTLSGADAVAEIYYGFSRF